MEKVRPSRSCNYQERPILSDVKKIKTFILPLAESEIIELHTILMTPAQRTIHTRDVVSGRILIETMLESLGYYQQVGCLTTSMKFQQNNVLDIYPIIQKDAQVHGLWHAIEEFFVNYNNIDFIWIEMTDVLLAQMGAKYIAHMCKILTEHKTMPVVVLQYDNC